MLHSVACTGYAPIVMRVVPRFLQAGSRFSTQTGSSAPSGIWNGYALLEFCDFVMRHGTDARHRQDLYHSGQPYRMPRSN